MARVVDCESGRELVDAVEIGSFLADHGLWYRTFAGKMDQGATDDEILAAHAGPIEELKAQGHYVTADVINVTKETPGLDDNVAIADALGLAPDQVLFLSDVVQELDAASTAGMKTGLMLRPGNKPTDTGKHRTYRSFEELLPQDS